MRYEERMTTDILVIIGLAGMFILFWVLNGDIMPRLLRQGEQRKKE